MEKSLVPQKKVLVVCQHFWPEVFRINDLCEGFVEHGLEVDVLCGEPNYPEGEWFDGYGPLKKRRQNYRGIHIHRTFEIKRGNNSKLRIFINYITFPLASIFHVPGLLKKKYDKVFIYSLSPVYMGIAGIIIGRLQKAEIVTYVMDLWPENLYSVLYFKNAFIRKMLMLSSTWFYKNSDKLICLSNHAIEILKERTGKVDEKFCFIPQCCEKIYETPIQDKELETRFAGGFNVVYAGNISPAQDFPTILQTAEQLKSEGYCINWIIVGDGMSSKEVQAAVQKRGLSELFFFEGFKPVEDIPKYTAIASCLIACLVKSPLLDCTIPAKVMSYIASGRPIVLAMDGEANTLINESGCGLACASGDAAGLADNLRKIYALSKAERTSMGERGRRLHFERFERDKNLEKMLRFMFFDGNEAFVADMECT